MKKINTVTDNKVENPSILVVFWGDLKDEVEWAMWRAGARASGTGSSRSPEMGETT